MGNESNGYVNENNVKAIAASCHSVYATKYNLPQSYRCYSDLHLSICPKVSIEYNNRLQNDKEWQPTTILQM